MYNVISISLEIKSEAKIKVLDPYSCPAASSNRSAQSDPF